ncbi:putative thiamine-phosphate synthase [Desulfuromonas versatilis]|uniref:Thiamine-phosphate synthase n=1 Tax=Desulfuromonas versatilis TaxID=2802975 RepID=A0ABM8HUE7_9BACT|nr:thiamine phosphate synthase [Desulfuromonas versatilis]BCR05952.1 putative thiamine-phosphate synthase [Desulfuromonas versatilis]
MSPVDFNLYLITDRKAVPPGRSLPEVIRGALEGGVRAVQLREKDLGARELYPLALELRRLTREFGARLLINDRIDVALAVEADGVHLGGQSLGAAAARRILGPGRLIGVSTHSLAEAETAQGEGADFLTFGPVYPTPSKAAYGAPVGPGELERTCRALRIPVFALGGVKERHIPEILSAGAAGIALISALITSPAPRSTAANLLKRLTL